MCADHLKFVGPTFWDQPILTFLGIEHIPEVAKYIPNKGLNEAFMWFGGLGLASNIVTRSAHSHRAAELR